MGRTMKLLLHAFQLFCLTPFPSTKGKFFLAEVKDEQTVHNSRVTSDIGEKSESQGQDYFHISADYLEGKNGKRSKMSKPGKSEDNIFHPSCLKNNTFLGAKVISTKYTASSPEDCHKECTSSKGCDAFTWTNYNASICFLYRLEDIEEWSPRKSTNYASISYFISCGRLVCKGKALMNAGSAPMRIGGRCPNQGESDCKGKCQSKSKPCDGKCDFPLCREGDECLETLEGGGIGGKILRIACDGVCQDPKKKSNGTCDKNQCWEEEKKECLQPGFSGSEGWKKCGDKCIEEEELCEGLCEEKLKSGDPDKYCWEPKENACKSTEERNKDGSLVRKSCHCICHPYPELCDGSCDRTQCQEEDSCVEELEKKDGKRVRTSCEGKCVPWGEKCVFNKR